MAEAYFADGIEKCDECEEPIEECSCVCYECDDNPHECGCEEG